ncbi:MAG: TIGR03643 family protein [Gammaproteobacteria bacterium]|mgnify:FL=1|tara:strand:+ start:256 stop:492 length:237 start_codon:yes stop_codon:yes gene_type:complete
MKTSDISRIIEMAWEDRTSFDAIQDAYGLNEKEVKELMKSQLQLSSYKLWRRRVTGRKTKHTIKRDFVIGRHKSPNKR